MGFTCHLQVPKHRTPSASSGTVGGPEQASVHHGYCSPHEHTGKGLIPGSTPSIATKGTHPGRTGCITLLNAYSSAVVPVSQPGPDVCVPEGTTQGPVGLTWGCVLELQPGFQNVPADFRQEHHGWSIHDAGTLRDCPQHTASRSPMWVWWALPGVRWTQLDLVVVCGPGCHSGAWSCSCRESLRRRAPCLPLRASRGWEADNTASPSQRQV